MPEDGSPYYFDTVTLSNFALSDRLDILVSRYGPRLCVSHQVLDEVIEGIVSGHPRLQTIEDAVASARFTLSRLPAGQSRQIYKELLRVLSPGEASCLSSAVVDGGTVVTDDMTARVCCAERSVAYTGTTGILKACVLDGSITSGEADDILTAMIQAGFYSPVTSISSLL